MVDGVRVGRLPALDNLEKPRPQPAVVREEIVRPEALPLAEPVDDVHLLRPPPLDPRDLLRVEAELEDVRGLGAARELGVDDLVRPARKPLEKVREPVPGTGGIVKACLVDDVNAFSDRTLGGRGRALPIAVVEVDGRDGAPLVEEPLHVTRLVVVPFPPNELRVRVVPVGPLELLTSDRKLKRGQMRAREEPVEVGG